VGLAVATDAELAVRLYQGQPLVGFERTA